MTKTSNIKVSLFETILVVIVFILGSGVTRGFISSKSSEANTYRDNGLLVGEYGDQLALFGNDVELLAEDQEAIEIISYQKVNNNSNLNLNVRIRNSTTYTIDEFVVVLGIYADNVRVNLCWHGGVSLHPEVVREVRINCEHVSSNGWPDNITYKIYAAQDS